MSLILVHFTFQPAVLCTMVRARRFPRIRRELIAGIREGVQA